MLIARGAIFIGSNFVQDCIDSCNEPISNLEREFCWKAAETFETGIRKTVEWYLSNQDWTRKP